MVKSNPFSTNNTEPISDIKYLPVMRFNRIGLPHPGQYFPSLSVLQFMHLMSTIFLIMGFHLCG